MRTVGLIGMRQQRSSFAQEGDGLACRFGSNRVEYALVERLNQFVNRHQ
jgi:hypothetical protein